MLQLPNGCRCSNLSVHPKSWDKKNPPLRKEWRIQYRFYDPSQKKPKLVVIKRMNAFKTLKDRVLETKRLIQEECVKLQKGFNPFKKKSDCDYSFDGAGSQTPLVPCLKWAMTKLSKASSTMSDIGCVIRGVEKAVVQLGLESIPISGVSRQVMKKILNECGTVVPGWSPNRYNKYRAYLKILFSELIEYEVIESDPVQGIKKQKTTKRTRRILTPEERARVSEYLKEHDVAFWRFVQIFFHSGARITELMLVKKDDVDIDRQRFRVIVRKGRAASERWKVIKDISVPFWVEQLNLAKTGEYLFSFGLIPGKQAISTWHISKKWRTWIKKPLEQGGLGIEADFYSLKHLHSTEISELLSNTAAAIHNSHSSLKMVTQVYDVRFQERQEEMVRQLHNSFSTHKA